MVRTIRRTLTRLLLALPIAAGTALAQTPVNLATWTAQSYPAVAGFGAGVWTVAAGGNSVNQSVNGQPTLFAGDFLAHGTEVRGSVRVDADGDDDFFGFALGYRLGDITNASADYLLVDWKQGEQFFDFGAPSTTPGTTARRGLAVSRVTGVPTADEFWGHTNFAADTRGGVQELARGATLGATPWSEGVTYDFRFVFLPDLLQVFVNGTLELNISGAFANGSMAFYNFSQSNVTYSAFTVKPADPSVVPEPATSALLLGGMGVLGLVARRRRTRQAAA